MSQCYKLRVSELYSSPYVSVWEFLPRAFPTTSLLCFASAYAALCSGVGGGYGGPQSTGGGMNAGGGATGGGPGNPGVQEGGGPQQYHPSPSALSAAAMVAAATATATATASVVALQERQEMNSQFSQVSNIILTRVILRASRTC